MKDITFLLIHLLTTTAKLLWTGGSKTIIAENLLLKQQLIIHNRSRQRAPNLSAKDRSLLGFWSLFLNPRRIAQQINLAFGLDLDKDTVRRVLATHYKSDPSKRGPSWFTTIGHAKDSLWSVDLFRCESIGPAPRLLNSHWVMVVMDQDGWRKHCRGLFELPIAA